MGLGDLDCFCIVEAGFQMNMNLIFLYKPSRLKQKPAWAQAFVILFLFGRCMVFFFIVCNISSFIILLFAFPGIQSIAYLRSFFVCIVANVFSTNLWSFCAFHNKNILVNNCQKKIASLLHYITNAGHKGFKGFHKNAISKNQHSQYVNRSIIQPNLPYLNSGIGLLRQHAPV